VRWYAESDPGSRAIPCPDPGNGPGSGPPGVSFHAIPAPPAQPGLPPGTPYTAAVGLPGDVNPDTVALPAPNLLSEGSVVTP
jgi:hypothetical protein